MAVEKVIVSPKINFWAPDGRKYSADSWEEANAFCEKMAREKMLPSMLAGEAGVFSVTIDQLDELIEKRLAERAASKSAKPKKTK